MPLDDPWFDGPSYLPDPEEVKKADDEEFVKIVWSPPTSPQEPLWFALTKKDFEQHLNRLGSAISGVKVVLYGGSMVEQRTEHMPLDHGLVYRADIVYLRQFNLYRATRATTRQVEDRFGQVASILWMTYTHQVNETQFSHFGTQRPRKRTASTINTTKSTTDTTQENTAVKKIVVTRNVSSTPSVVVVDTIDGIVGQVVIGDAIVWQSTPNKDDYDSENEVWGTKARKAAEDKIRAVFAGLFAVPSE